MIIEIDKFILRNNIFAHHINSEQFLNYTGALCLPDLKTRFAVVRAEVRAAAFVPENANNIFGEFYGYALASVMTAPR